MDWKKTCPVDICQPGSLFEKRMCGQSKKVNVKIDTVSHTESPHPSWKEGVTVATVTPWEPLDTAPPQTKLEQLVPTSPHSQEVLDTLRLLSRDGGFGWMVFFPLPLRVIGCDGALRRRQVRRSYDRHPSHNTARMEPCVLLKHPSQWCLHFLLSDECWITHSCPLSATQNHGTVCFFWVAQRESVWENVGEALVIRMLRECSWFDVFPIYLLGLTISHARLDKHITC